MKRATLAAVFAAGVALDFYSRDALGSTVKYHRYKGDDCLQAIH